LEEFPFSDREIRDINRVVLIGMGTSLHAAVVGRNWIESLSKLPAEADSSSEFRHRDVVIDEQTLVISICQSGETADTLAAMEIASAKGARQVTLCNYEGTQTTRISHGTVLIRAGLEIGVAASKTFVSSLTALYLITLYMAEKRGVIEQERLHELIRELVRLPNLIGGLLENDSQYERLARRYAGNTNFLYLGRGINYPMAMEGALKLKEISYIHAEGYPAGEMKHGPISLIDEHMPVVALVPNDALYEKMYSNVREVLSRGGRVIAIVTEGDEAVSEIAHDVVCLPRTSTMVTPMLMAVPLQLIAYHTAVQLGCDVDKPRNLAKSVTVE
jgi:glucosamine--fructose-6-phosphate aminotransferase (isomerizing)